MDMRKGYRTPSWFRTTKRLKDKHNRILTLKRKSSSLRRMDQNMGGKK
jgi:hypothetical protein